MGVKQHEWPWSIGGSVKTKVLPSKILFDPVALIVYFCRELKIANLDFCRDKGVDMFIHAALASFSPWLVTGNRDLLEVAAIPGLMIITRTDALNHAQFGGS